MPLMRDKIIGHDNERLAFQFTMLNGESVVPCQISDAAMDGLAGTAGTESSARQARAKHAPSVNASAALRDATMSGCDAWNAAGNMRPMAVSRTAPS